jgi:hypothetical protein
MRILSLHPWHPKKETGRSRGSDFHLGKWSCELIIGLLDVLIIQFSDVDEAMFQVVERQCELIFYVLGIQKSEVELVAEVIFLVGERP